MTTTPLLTFARCALTVLAIATIAACSSSSDGADPQASTATTAPASKAVPAESSSPAQTSAPTKSSAPAKPSASGASASAKTSASGSSAPAKPSAPAKTDAPAQSAPAKTAPAKNAPNTGGGACAALALDQVNSATGGKFSDENVGSNVCVYIGDDTLTATAQTLPGGLKLADYVKTLEGTLPGATSTDITVSGADQAKVVTATVGPTSNAMVVAAKGTQLYQVHLIGSGGQSTAALQSGATKLVTLMIA